MDDLRLQHIHALKPAASQALAHTLHTHIMAVMRRGVACWKAPMFMGSSWHHTISALG